MSLRLEIRDPIHGFIYREPEERDVIDTGVFQRLRRLKQLAMATLVYPGATHSRFEHSLGAFHLAGKIARALAVPESESKLVRLAALLHDIGHGPFSHVTEPILRKHSDTSKLGAEISESKIHEIISWQIIKNSPELGKLISDKHREQIVGLLTGSWNFRYLQEIVSGAIDADKQDYLLRDSLFSGVKYGVYDQERLANTLVTFQHLSKERDPKAARAELYYRVERILRGASLVRVGLVTGLQHQIRVQLSALGHPVIGDRKYHPEEALERRITRVALHAAHLEFLHPRSGERVSIDCEPPADFQSLLRSLSPPTRARR